MDQQGLPIEKPVKEAEQRPTSAASPKQAEASQRLPPRPGVRPGLDDRRHILDSPVLLPLMTVRSGFVLCRTLRSMRRWAGV